MSDQGRDDRLLLRHAFDHREGGQRITFGAMWGSTRIRTKMGHLTEQCSFSAFIAPNAEKWGALTTSQCRVFVLIGPITAPNGVLAAIS